ncbi:uncharacterized protein METZ01_LOCUS159235, partial [marine metagenome]
MDRHSPKPAEVSMQKNLLYVLPVLVLISLLAFFLWPENLSDRAIFPYISHQKPILDPHL